MSLEEFNELWDKAEANIYENESWNVSMMRLNLFVNQYPSILTHESLTDVQRIILSIRDQNYDTFIKSNVPWCYLFGMFQVKNLAKYEITEYDLRDERLVNFTNEEHYKILLFSLKLDPIPLNFVKHYQNISVFRYKGSLFWDLIGNKRYDLIHIYSEFVTFDPLKNIAGLIFINDLSRNHEEMYDKLLDSFRNFELLSKTTDNNSLFDKVTSTLNNFTEIEISQTYPDINSDNVLENIWEKYLTEEKFTIDSLTIADYFDYMTMDEKIIWWDRLEIMINKENNKVNHAFIKSSPQIEYAKKIFKESMTQKANDKKCSFEIGNYYYSKIDNLEDVLQRFTYSFIKLILGTTSEAFLEFASQKINLQKADVISHIEHYGNLSKISLNFILERILEIRDELIRLAICIAPNLLTVIAPDITIDEILELSQKFNNSN